MLVVEIVNLLLLLALLGLAVVILAKLSRQAGGASLWRSEFERQEACLRGEFAGSRQEQAEAARNLRLELLDQAQKLGGTLHSQVLALGDGQGQQFKGFSERLETLRAALAQAAQAQREELVRNQQHFAEMLDKRLAELAKSNEARLAEMAAAHAALLNDMSQASNQRLEAVRTTLDAKLEAIRLAMVEQLDKVRQENGAKLEEMRKTVDEKLHDTLEKRLGESFKQVSERLEQVHQGLGEMQSLATGVGDLKKVLTNVKTRGTWGEIQLGNLLEQMLTADQYVKQARPKPRSAEVVEFAIKLPGRDDDDQPVLLPIDAKFPKEDYERLVDASEKGDLRAVDEAVRQLEARIKHEARSIRDKYIQPPYTTDFAILYLPIEGLYAEVLRRPGLAESLQRDYRVTVAGPTTLAALLNSLQMGFRTLAIQKRSSEVWKILAAVKKKFEMFGETFARVQKKIQEADRAIETAKNDTRIIGNRLRSVEAMSDSEATRLLAPAAEGDDTSSDDGDEAAAPPAELG